MRSRVSCSILRDSLKFKTMYATTSRRAIHCLQLFFDLSRKFMIKCRQHMLWKVVGKIVLHVRSIEVAPSKTISKSWMPKMISKSWMLLIPSAFPKPGQRHLTFYRPPFTTRGIWLFPAITTIINILPWHLFIKCALPNIIIIKQHFSHKTTNMK